MKEKPPYSQFIFSSTSNNTIAIVANVIRQEILHAKRSRSWFNTATHQANGTSYKLPVSAKKAVVAIEKADKGEISYVEALAEVDKVLKEDQQNLPEYQRYRVMLKNLMVETWQASRELIDKELNFIYAEDAKDSLSQKTPAQKIHVNNLIQLKLNLQLQIDRFDKQEEVAVFDMDAVTAGIGKKSDRFKSKNILPFADKLTTRVPGATDATEDLRIILHAILQDTTNKTQRVQTRQNAMKEIEVEITHEDSSKSRYNLTQIMRHAPDFKKLNLSHDDLELYFNYLKGESSQFRPNRIPSASLGGWEQFTSEQVAERLDAHLGKKGQANDFKNCHAAHLLAINMYTDKYYVIMNKFLRDKTLGPDLFTAESLEGNPVAAVFRSCEATIERSKAGEALNPEELDKVIKETLMSVLIGADGLNKAKSLGYDPDKTQTLVEGKLQDETLSLDNARTMRGAAGVWVPDVKKAYRIAYEGGTPVYMEGFLSSSFSVKKAVDFMNEGEGEKMVTKVKAAPGAAVVYVEPITASVGEKELLVPPGSLVLPRPERKIKHQAYYGNEEVDQKVSTVITAGVSEISQMYSSKINEKRTQLLDKYAEVQQLLADKTLNLADREQLETMQSTLDAGISALATQAKRVDIVISKNPPTLEGMDDKADLAFVFTPDKRVFVVDKGQEKITECKVDMASVDHIMTEFELTSKLEELSQSPATVKKIASEIGLSELNYLKKYTNQDKLHTAKSEKESMVLFDAVIKKFNQNCAKLSPALHNKLSQGPPLDPAVKDFNHFKNTLTEMKETKSPQPETGTPSPGMK